MPRIRTLKPEFWTDEKLALLDPLSRLVFLGLISMADDYGRLIDNIKMLDGQLFPFTDDTVSESLETLAQLSRILRYTSTSGQNLIQIVGWKNHQKVDHPGKEILPAPTKEDWLKPVAGQRPITPPRKPRGQSSRKPRETLAQPSRSDLGPTTLDLGPTTETIPSGYALLSRESGEMLHAEWSKHFGGFDPFRFRKEILPVFQVPESQRPSPESVRAAIEAFGEWWEEQEDRDQSFWGLKKFVETISKWIGYGQMPLTLNGKMTERGAWAGSKKLRQQRRIGIAS